MKLPTAYDPFYLNRNQGLRKGRISVNPTAGIDASLGVKWWNSQESGNDFILITDNYSTGRTNNINDGTPLFYPMGRTQANILTTVNGLRNSPKGFTTSGSALEFLAQSGYFIIDPYNPPPQLVTSGSIVYLDSRQIMSFPTTGSGWYDMSGWNNNAILTTCSFSSSAITFPSPASAVTINYITQSTEGMTISFNARMKKPLAAITSSLGNGNINVINSFSQSIGQTVVKYNNIACTFEASATSSTLVRKIYVNGDLTSENTINAPFDPIGAPSYVNIFTDNGAGSNSLQNVQMYQRVLSQDEIKQNLFQAPIITDGLVLAVDSGNIVSYETGSTTTYSLTGSLTGSLANGVGYNQNNGGNWNFDGVDDYISVPYTPILTPTSAITLSTWASSSWSSLTGQRCIISKTQGGGYQLSVNEPSFYPSGLGILFYLGGAYRSASLSTSLVSNGWHYIVSTFDGQYIRLYLDGIERASYNYGSEVLIAYNNNNHFLIAAEPGAGTAVDGAYFPGKIGITQVYNRALSSTEVLQNFNAQRTRFNV
jgi:hypothetical protein